MNEVMLNNMTTDELLHVFMDDDDPKLRLVATKLFQEKEDWIAEQKIENEEQISMLEGKIEGLEEVIVDLKSEKKELEEDIEALEDQVAELQKHAA